MVGEDTVEGEAKDQTRLDFAFVFLHVVVVVVAEAELVLGHHEPPLVRIIIGGGGHLDSLVCPSIFALTSLILHFSSCQLYDAH